MLLKSAGSLTSKKLWKPIRRTHGYSCDCNEAQGFFLERNERNPVVMGPRSSPEAFFPQPSEGKCAEGMGN